MKLRSLLLNSVATWLLFAGPVQAAPVVGAVTAFAGWLGAGSVGALIVKGAIALGAQVGMSLAAKAKQKKQLANQPARGVEVSARIGDNAPASFIVGRYATPGVRTYIGSWGQAGKTPNAYLTDVLEISCLPVPGLASMWAGDKKCTILWSEPTANGAGCPVQEFRVNGTDYMWVKFVSGSQTVADPFLREKFGTATPRPYKDTMIGRGCAYVIVTTRVNADLFPSGKPEYLFEPSPPVFYDLRKDSTNGGSGPHRWNDRATWEPTENNAIIAYNIIRGVYYLNNEWIYGGQSLAAFRLPASNWMAAANECDRLITKADGSTEKQFRCGYEVQVNAPPLQLLEELRIGSSGQYAEVGGVFKMSVGAPGAAVYQFTDDDVVVTSAQELDPFPTLDDIHNGIEGEYPEPENRWVMKPAPPRYDAALEALDGDRRLATGIDFPTTPFPTQVQRLMETMLKDGRRFAVHSINLPPVTKVLEPNDVVSWTSARNGYFNKKFLIVRKAGAASFRQGFILKEIDPTDHGWTPGQEIPSPIGGGVGPIVVPPQPMYGWTVEPYEVRDTAGTPRRPSIKVSCSPDQDDVKNILVEVRLKSSQEVVFQSDATAYAHPYSWVLPGTFLPNTQYEVRGKFVPYSNRPTEWSNWITVTTPNILIGSVDILDNAITSQKIAEAAVTAGKIMNEAVTSLKLADQAVTTAKLQVAAVTDQILANGAVVSSKLADAAVTAAKLANAAVDATKFAAGIKPVEVVDVLPVTGNTEGRQAYLTTDGKLYRFRAGQWVKDTAAADITGQLVSSQLADALITNSKLAALAVDAAKLATGAVTETKIADNAITTPKLVANAVVSDKIATNAITARTLLLADLENLVPNGNIEDIAPIATYWGSVTNGGSISYLTKDAWPALVQTGTRSINLQKPNGGEASSIWIDQALPGGLFPVIAGEVLYGETAIITNQTPTSAGAYYRILWYDATQTIIPGGDGVGYANIADNVPITNSWVAHSRKVVVPANAAFGRVRLYNHSTQTTTHNLIFDRLILRRANAANLIVDGSLTATMIAASAITSDKLAVGAVTAGKIAAGAVSASELAAGAVIAGKIAAGAVTADTLAIGKGANWLPNSDLFSGITGWAQEYTNAPAGTFDFRFRQGDTYAPYPGVLEVVQFNGTQNVEFGVFMDPAGVGADVRNVVGGKWYEFSGYYLGHWCKGIQPYLQFIDGNGTHIGWYNPGVLPASQNTDPGGNLANYQRFFYKVQAPANAARVRPFFRMKGTVAGGTYSHLWVTKLFFGEATANQTTPSDWSPAGITVVQGGNIVTGAVTADKIAANAVVAGKIAAGAVTATELAAGAVTAVKIAASAITGDKIAANTIGANHIAAGAITAKQLVVTDFENLVANGYWTESNPQAPAPYWAGSGGTNLHMTGSYNQTGQYSLVLQKTDINGSVYMELQAPYAFAVTGGEQLYGEISAMSNGAAAPGGLYFRIQWFDSTRTNYLGYADFVLNAPVGNGFETRSGKATVPANARWATLQVFNHNTNTVTQNFIIDRIVVRRMKAANLIVDGSITADKLAVTSLSAISGSFGDAYFSGVARSVNGKLLIDFNTGGFEVFT